MPVTRIVSGGQTGADRGGLDAAMVLGLSHGGWCPKGRRAEDGTIPARYRLAETESPVYAVRTKRNVLDSDGTLIVSRGPLAGGSALTARLARAHHKPVLHIDLDQWQEQRDGARRAAEALRDWLRRHEIAVLNVAGPRASHCPGIARDVEELLVRALGPE